MQYSRTVWYVLTSDNLVSRSAQAIENSGVIADTGAQRWHQYRHIDGPQETVRALDVSEIRPGFS
jgi:hypothetical protein